MHRKSIDNKWWIFKSHLIRKPVIWNLVWSFHFSEKLSLKYGNESMKSEDLTPRRNNTYLGSLPMRGRHSIITRSKKVISTPNLQRIEPPILLHLPGYFSPKFFFAKLTFIRCFRHEDREIDPNIVNKLCSAQNFTSERFFSSELENFFYFPVSVFLTGKLGKQPDGRG